MRWVTVLLVSLLLLLQWPLWFGERGWFAVQRLENQLSQQEQANALAQQDNNRLAAEVQDLKTGLGGVQDQARRLADLFSGLRGGARCCAVWRG